MIIVTTPCQMITMNNNRIRSRLTIDTESLSYINGTGILKPDSKGFKVLSFIFAFILLLWIFNSIRALVYIIDQALDLYNHPRWGYRGPLNRIEDEHRLAYLIGDLLITLVFQAVGWFALIKKNMNGYAICFVITLLSVPLPILADQNHLAINIPIVLILALIQSTIIGLIIREIYISSTDFNQGSSKRINAFDF